MDRQRGVAAHTVWLDTPPETSLLAGLHPRQLELELLVEK